MDFTIYIVFFFLCTFIIETDAESSRSSSIQSRSFSPDSSNHEVEIHKYLDTSLTKETKTISKVGNHIVCNMFCTSVYFFKDGVFNAGDNRDRPTCDCYHEHLCKNQNQTAMKYDFNKLINVDLTKTQNCDLSCKLNENETINDSCTIFGVPLKSNFDNYHLCICYHIESTTYDIQRPEYLQPGNDLEQELECQTYCENCRIPENIHLVNRYAAYYVGKIFRSGPESLKTFNHPCTCFRIKDYNYLIDQDKYNLIYNPKENLDDYEACEAFCKSIFYYVNGMLHEDSGDCLCTIDDNLNVIKTHGIYSTFKWTQISNKKLTRTQNCNISCKQKLAAEENYFQFGVYYNTDKDREYCACYTNDYALKIIETFEMPRMSQENLEIHALKFYQTRKPDFKEETLCDNKCKAFSNCGNLRGYYVANIFQSQSIVISGWKWPCHCFDISQSKPEQHIVYQPHSLKQTTYYNN